MERIKPPTKGDLVELYHNQKKSLVDIGKLYSRSGATIRYHMKKHGIKRRTYMEGIELKANEKRVYFKCPICNENFHVGKSEVRRRQKDGGKIQCCSNKCKGILSRGRQLKETHKLKHRFWRTKRLREEIGLCEICGFKEEPRILTTHHKDGDRNNNSRENLILLCPNCHSLEHLKMGKGQTPIVSFGVGKTLAEKTCAFCEKTFKPITSGRSRSQFCYACLPHRSIPQHQAIRRRLNKYVAGLITKDEVLVWRKKLESGENMYNKVWSVFEK